MDVEFQFIHFTEGATDPLEEFDARGVRFVPLAAGEEERDATVSCLHFAAGGWIAEAPCFHDGVLLVVHGELTVCGMSRLQLYPGMGVVLGAGQPAQLESRQGAIVIAIESPRLRATARGISTPERIMGQRWPGWQPPPKSWLRSWWMPRLLRKILTVLPPRAEEPPCGTDHRLPPFDAALHKERRGLDRGFR